jgi:hypothetical protein
MRPVLLGWLLAFTLVATGNGQTNPTSAPEHFRWSERRAHELDYHHTIATAADLTAQERSELLSAVLNRFKHPVSPHDAAMFEDMTDEELAKLAGDTRIDYFDLNGDGTNETIAQGNGLGACGGTGNCILMVFLRTPQGLKLILDSRAGKWGGGVEKIRVLDTSTNGFRDVVLASHISASDRTLALYRYSDGGYRPVECYYATMQPHGVPEGLQYPDISRGCPGDK